MAYNHNRTGYILAKTLLRQCRRKPRSHSLDQLGIHSTRFAPRGLDPDIPLERTNGSFHSGRPFELYGDDGHRTCQNLSTASRCATR